MPGRYRAAGWTQRVTRPQKEVEVLGQRGAFSLGIRKMEMRTTRFFFSGWGLWANTKKTLKGVEEEAHNTLLGT